MFEHALVTGGAGFIGSHLTEALLQAGARVTVIDDQSTGSRENLVAVSDLANLRCVDGCVTDRPLIHRLLGDVDVVFHLAAAVGVRLIDEQPIQSVRLNIMPVQILLEELLELHQVGNSKPLFIASSSEVYGKNPNTPWSEDADLIIGRTDRARWSYGAAKAIDEFLALAYWREHLLPIVVGRFFNVVGPRQSGAYGMVLPSLVRRALAGEPPIVHDDGQQIRCFAHVHDVVQMVLRLMQTPQSAGQVYNIGSDEPISILDLARRVVDQVDPQLSIEFQPYCQAYSADFEDVRVRVPDLTKLRSTIDYQLQYNLNAIIRNVVDAMQQNSPFA